ncbi:hypothetical protein NDU88_008584 [Pleurodeles waltl]|uniref:Uncharacterized protein n=1 Tax=Pleurodeles waltl TaxID=8319 RepID=A0AAV7PWL2_PLEWA|nr:hypothetical protein NDU88_008584 [Pleurodeles waltl]
MRIVDFGSRRGGTFGPFKLDLRARFAGRVLWTSAAGGAGPLAPSNLTRVPASRDARCGLRQQEGRDLLAPLN